MVKENFYNKDKLRRLNMLVTGKPKYNSRGKIVKDAIFQSSKKKIGRIQPSRNWFTSTKLVEHNELDKYREATSTNSIPKSRNSGTYQALLKTGKVPGSLIYNEVKRKKLEMSYGESFGKSNTANKEYRNTYTSIQDILNKSKEAMKTLEDNLVKQKLSNIDQSSFKNKGNGKVTFNELYKVLDTSDIVVHVLDVRNPKICKHVLAFMEKNKHKYLIYLLNKVDLVPKEVTESWIKALNKEHPVVAYHTYFKNSVYNSAFGKENLINLMKQLKRMFLSKGTSTSMAKSQISVGFVGYPNTGKSTIINTLASKKVCSAAPVPGQTKSWQMVSLYKDIYLIDSPGVIPFVADEPGLSAIVDGGIRIENIDSPDMYIPEVMALVKKETLIKIYNLKMDFTTSEELIESIGRRNGLLMKGGLVNSQLVSRKILYDLVKGKLPYYKLPSTDK